MQDKMECDWFKPTRHDVIHLRPFKNIQLQNSQQILNLKSTNPTKSHKRNNCVSTLDNKKKSLKHRHK